MAGLSDLETQLATDLTNLTSAVTSGVNEIAAQAAQIKTLLASGTVTPADITALQTIASGIEAQTTAMNSAVASVTPPPTPTPTPTP